MEGKGGAAEPESISSGVLETRAFEAVTRAVYELGSKCNECKFLIALARAWAYKFPAHTTHDAILRPRRNMPAPSPPLNP